MTSIELGNIGNIDQVQKLVQKLDSKSYMNFMVLYYPIEDGNFYAIIATEKPDTTEDELKNMVLFYLACEL